MAGTRFSRVQRVGALVSLALLSAAWTASLAGVGPGSGPSATAPADAPAAILPDGSFLPGAAVEAPASVGSPNALAPPLSGSDAQQVVGGSSTRGIPAAALTAYQRAATVINAADPGCRIPWELVAAIGRVESDHGRFGGNHLDGDGVATPGIYGLPLDGTHGTSLIADTDDGRYDRDTVFDRAVGPMQFIPSTWAVVGVDADADSRRDPQDVDDAALGTAVYLCSGPESLATDAGRRPAVHRYNHSDSYVDLVLAVMHSYQSGDWAAVPDNTTSATYFPVDTSFPGTGPSVAPAPHTPSGAPEQSAGSGPDPSAPPTAPPSGPAHPPAPGPSTEPSHGSPVDQATSDPVGTVTGAVSDPVGTVEDTLTYLQAVAACTAQGLVDNPLSGSDPFDACMAGHGY